MCPYEIFIKAINLIKINQQAEYIYYVKLMSDDRRAMQKNMGEIISYHILDR